MPRFVLEIGTEEIPPRFFPPALAQLYADGDTMFKRARLVAPDLPADRYLRVYGTPRRLVLIAEQLAAQQAASTREERGPAARVAFDADGKPTKAALGFARKHNIAADDLVPKDTDQGKYVFAIVHDPELPAKDALAPLLPELISGLSFPKSMRWGTGKLRFGRPIRWLLALVDDQVVEFQLEGLHSGRETRGHPVLADGILEIADAERYEEALRKRHVIVDPGERLNLLNDQLLDISQSLEGRVAYIDMPGSGSLLPELIAEPDRFSDALGRDLALQTTFLVEYPTAACGSFDPSFARLPREVLVEEMEHVQSYFPLENAQGDLLPKFIAVRDGGSEHLDGVLKGWQSVLRAKLIDADFFYREDLKRPLADRVEDLRGVVFHEKLGTMHDKVARVRAVATDLAKQMGLAAQHTEWLLKAAHLCKADLTTAMVTELSDLQGEMGGVYAKENREPEEVWKAIRDHYRPRYAEDEAPGTEHDPSGTEDDPPLTTIGTFLAIADKIDTVTSYFAVGIRPSGSADPLGLRREAAGIVKCMSIGRLKDAQMDRDFLHLSLTPLAEAALRQLDRQVSLSRSKEEIIAEVIGFLRQRLETHLRDGGLRYDLAQAALAVGSDMIRDAARRAWALQNVARQQPDFLPIVIASTRVSNILKGVELNEDEKKNGPDDGLFDHPTERALWEAYLKVKPEAERQADEGEYEAFFGTVGTLRGLIDRFFDDVLVMHENPAIRRNRLALCWQLTQLFRRLADFSLIVQT